MRLPTFCIVISLFFLIGNGCSSIHSASKQRPKDYWQFAPTPPMGWNSYDSFGDSVTEAEVLANAQYMKDHLLSHGWNYVVIDFRWSDPNAHAKNPTTRPGPQLCADSFGRLTPAPNRFSSATDDHGFTPLANQIHATGLKFGIHVMRGIPRQSVEANTPIEGSHFRAADAADTTSTCNWNNDMYGVRADTPAGQAWYDSIVRQYASWGVDYMKVDDLSNPYSAPEIEALRRAIDKSHRPIVLSLSPGETPVDDADHVKTHANLWRITNDFWDQWPLLDHTFDVLASWQMQSGPGHWPDADMLPFGHLGHRCLAAGDAPRDTHFTHDEQITVMSLWAINSSPLMLGMNLPENDTWTNGLITNDEVLAIDQDKLGSPAVLLPDTGKATVWRKKLSNGSFAVGVFNRTDAAINVSFPWASIGLDAGKPVRDVWQHQKMDITGNTLKLQLPPHGAILLRTE